MTDTAASSTDLRIPRAFFIYAILYGGMTVLAGVVAFKQVQLWPSQLAVEAGIFPFLMLVVITSTIAQLYGQKMANKMVWIGFIPLAVSAALLLQPCGISRASGADHARGRVALRRASGHRQLADRQ